MLHYLLVFLISMVPLIELRGAIPYSVVWNIPLYIAFPLAIIGNMLPVPFIYFFARKILVWGADKPVIGKFFTFCLEKGEKGGRKLQEKAGKGLFVALLCLWASRFPVRAHGRERLRPAFWIWISNRAYWRAWAACCWQG